MRKFILVTLIILICLKSFTQDLSSINRSLSYINTFTKNLEDSGFEILNLNLSNYPFKIGSIKIDDFLANAYTGAKIFIKGIAIFQKDNLDYGKLAIEGKDKNDLDNEKSKEVFQESKYRKTVGEDGEVLYSWDMEYIPKRKGNYFHEIYFYVEPLIVTMEGTKDMGILPKTEESKNKITKKNKDQLILIVYRKASKSYI